jgi:eukaryotic-like serine/threonine-protein kinase
MSGPDEPADASRVGPGTRLGPYEVIAPLGSGGMGEVFLALDTRLRRHVAVKVLPAELSADRERLARLEREARTASALNHPNIVTVYDIGSSGSTSYIAMEFVEGKTLREVLLSGPLPVKRALEIASQAADGLAKAHAAGIVHRDLKPENLMVSKDGFVKILDFGLAKFAPRESGELSRMPTVTRAQTEEGTVLGTVGYMSPEQARGEAVDFRSDQFSFGAIFYEMVTGNRAFARGTYAETLSAILRDEPAPVEAVAQAPEALFRVIGRCLAKEPEARYGSTRDLAHDLRETLSSASVARPSSITQAQKRPGTRMGIAVTLGAAAVVALLAGLSVRDWRSRILGTSGVPAIRSIAVLPLDNLSRDPEQEYFADGMTEELITELAKIHGLRVISRTSVMRFKKTTKSLPEIARALHVEGIVEGSVRREGQRVRIDAQLIDAATDRHLWAESYDKDLRDVLAIQNEAARAIARAVQVRLTPQDAARLSRSDQARPEAYQDLLLGRFYFNKRTGEALKKSVAYYQSAIEKEPHYSAAYAGLAEAYDLLPLYSDIPPLESLRNAQDAALKALETDDTRSDAHVALAFSKFHYRWQWNDSEAEFQKAIRLNPASALAHHWYAELLTCRGRFDEALAERNRAKDLDPLNLTINAAIGGVYYFARHYDDAIAACKRALELDPSFGLAHMYLGEAYAEKKLYRQAIAEFKQMPDFLGGAGYALSDLGYAYAIAGDAAQAREILGRLEKPPGGLYFSSPLIAGVYAGLGERQKAITWLEKGVADGSVWIPYIGVSPKYDSLRKDARFEDLLRRVGLSS